MILKLKKYVSFGCMIKYFPYACKSTDEEDRQILSIESQIAELREFARKENITVTREFTESKTAKEPGREVFNEMLKLIEKGQGLRACLQFGAQSSRLARMLD